jgi:type I site-specific restriction endonuclease
MSNFTYLKTNWPDLCATASEAEQNVNSAPRTSCFYTRDGLPLAVVEAKRTRKDARIQGGHLT